MCTSLTALRVSWEHKKMEKSRLENVIATEIVSSNPESGYNYSVIFGFERNFDKQVKYFPRLLFLPNFFFMTASSYSYPIWSILPRQPTSSILLIPPHLLLLPQPSYFPTVLSLISAPGACKIEMKNLTFSLFLISVIFWGVTFTK